eukprot:TRINITY_DN23150_c0_g1_i1.p1 TRINITY_DN23150_c0_g1~~TRINITY_DN23150_c0_g1_i1.p1  ORF type:complete len:397 (-),score=90.46 TRINITY_DN23150_c0_g1_i1:127-1317(-)
MSCMVVSLNILLFAGQAAAKALRHEKPSNFMLISGATATEEACVTVSGTSILLESCRAAVTALDGHEIWKLTAAGQLASVSESKCLGVPGPVKIGASVTLLECDAAADNGKWELSGNGQIKLAAGGLCLSQVGPEVGLADVAVNTAATASSTLAASHGASLACDGVSSSYWASKLGVAEPVNFAVDLGSAEQVAKVVLDFEFVPKSFALFVSADGQRWQEVFSTDANVLRKVSVPVGNQLASTVKLEMRAAHPVHGTFGGYAVYGIRSLAVMAQRTRAAVDSCAAAAKSKDSRDKFFMAAVGSFDKAASAALRSELPALEAADASLAAITAELADVLPSLPGCRHGGSMLRRAISHRSRKTSQQTFAAAAASEGVDAEALYSEARATIIAARKVLH